MLDSVYCLLHDVTYSSCFLFYKKKSHFKIKKQYCHCESFHFWQDAHEFLNFLLNELVDILEKEAQSAKNDQETSPPSEKAANGPKNGLANGAKKEPLVTWVHKNFQVTLIYQFNVIFILACCVKLNNLDTK